MIAFEILFPICFFIIGVIFASFGNMLMYRMANNKPVLKEKRSYCPNCGAQIKWYDNIPIISWIALKGKCRSCHQPISPRYIITEIFGGILFLAIYFLYAYVYGDYKMVFTLDPIKLISAVSLSFILLFLYISAYVDSKTYIAPISLSVVMLIFALAKYLTYYFVTKDIGLDYLLGLSIPVGVLLLIYIICVLIMKIEPIGLGDVIIFGILGFAMGGIQLIMVVFFSSFICSVVEIIKIKKTKVKKPIPFVPYIFIGALITALIGPLMVTGFQNLIGGM